MKNCPFCKNKISEGDDKCPHCQRVLVERTQRAHTIPTNDHKIEQNIKQYFIKIVAKIKKINLNSINVYIPIIALIILIVFISTQRGGDNIQNNEHPISVIPNNKIDDSITVPRVKANDPKNFISLANGTVLFSGFFWGDGIGKLEINNGTSYDAIAKLVNIRTNKSVYTVYIKAKSILNIDKITDGNYKLYFNLGNDWDEQVKAFRVNSSYEVFEDIFDFITSEYEEGDYIHTKYSTFSVTLNPVIGGEARTNEVDPGQFGSY